MEAGLKGGTGTHVANSTPEDRYSNWIGKYMSIPEHKMRFLLFARSPLQNLWKEESKKSGAYVSDFFIRAATSEAQVINNFLERGW